ncbi:MAG: putative manganese-dependent inorganic diphosphatase [Coriobacteriales bacterium]|nr:putative manganese-dependent inorganic diphosphatase [Coriobacteriales bacterium]
MPDSIRKVNVIGHLNPDTDSICAAISYAYLKNQLDQSTVYEARRAGAVNRETGYALKHFGFEEPRLITSVRPQIKDLGLREQAGIDGETSLYVAWNLMREVGVSTLPITDKDRTLRGVIAMQDVTTANMDILDRTSLGAAATRYVNILDTLDATMVVGNPNDSVKAGAVLVGTTPEAMEGVVKDGDTVLVTDRYESQRFALEAGAGCLVVCCQASVSDDIKKLAKERGAAIIGTQHDTYAAARLISMSIPVRAKMRVAAEADSFSMNTAVDEAQKVMARTGHRFFPVLDEEGHYYALISGADMVAPQKKHVILVDHAEVSQMVDGMDEAEILEVIDHHRVGTLETPGPIFYRLQPVGCTCTIVYEMFIENGIEIPANIAGLMMSAILSDTLCFRSPTCTPRDIYVGKELAKICGEDPDTYSDAMFDAGADLEGRAADEVFNSDFKIFSRGNVSWGVGQGSYMTENSRKAGEELLKPYFETAAKIKDVPMIFYMFTDIKSQTTEMLYWGNGAEHLCARAFNVEAKDGMAVLPGVVSRKKQVIPAMMNTLAKLEAEE